MSTQRWIAAAVVLAALGGAAWWARQAPESDGGARADGGRVAVEVASVETGRVADVRAFTGTLEAGDAFTVAPKIGGQVERVHVDIGDRVEQGQVIAELDDDEAAQAVAEAEAALAVARAELQQAESDARLARRELERTRSLADRELTSASELDTASARAEAQRAAVAVARARVKQREAALARAEVQQSYTRVRADWRGGDSVRVVGERMVNAGDTVAANTPLVSVLGIAPITAAVFAPESDYALLSSGQAVTVTADALPTRTFEGRISRIAPRFESDSRQARFEVTLANEDRALKPGMFVTVRVTVATAEGARLVPREAIVQRASGAGVYHIEPGESATVRWVPIEPGIEGDEYVEVRSPALDGRVVTLGQQLLEDGAPVTIAELPGS